MRLISIIAATVGLSVGPVMAETDPQVVCTITDCNEVTLAVPEFADASNFTTSQVWALVGEIMAVSGLAPNFQVIESRDVSNAAATMRSADRIIVFNPDWLARVGDNASSKWEVYAVLAHEIGHHLQGHALLGIGSRPPIELQADEYAGFALGALGATQDQAQSLWQGFSEEGSPTHPPRHQRLDAVERGWNRARALFAEPALAVETAANTRPLPVPTVSLARDRSADTSCMPVLTSLGQAVTCVTSQLVGDDGTADTPAVLFDADPETAWVEDGVQFGAGETIAVEFNAPTDIRRILFHNGAVVAGVQSLRIKELIVKSSGGFEGSLTLQDRSDLQFLPVPLGAVEWITFTIVDVFPAEGPQDAALAEIAFE